VAVPPDLIRQAYEAALRSQNPSPGQLQWRLSRFARGLRLVSEIETIHGPLKNTTLVDFGAAHGGDYCAFLSAGAQAIAVDFRNYGYDQLARALQPLGLHVKAVLADANRSLPFDESRFDIIVSMNLVEHLPDTARARFFGDVWRLLRPGGVAFLTTPVAWKGVRADPFYGCPFTAVLPMRLRRFVAERLFRRTYPFPLRGRTCYSVRAIAKPARRVGFTVQPYKFRDSRAAERVGNWPLSPIWSLLIRRYAFDFIVLRKPATAQNAQNCVRQS
jgi:SAM-dependent methyltransferase